MGIAKKPSLAARSPKVTQADLCRAADFLKAIGAKVAVLDILPGQMKIVTTDGRIITGDEDDLDLDQELQRYRDKSRGVG